MTEYNINDELFDAICKAAFSQYIIDKCKTYPSKEETDAMFTIPKRGRRRLKRALKAKEYGKPLFVVYFQRVAIVLLVTIAVTFGVLMTNTEVRAAISNAIIKWSEKNILFKFGGDDPVSDSSDNSEVNINSIKINYVPEGMYLANTRESDNAKKYTYYSSLNEDIFLKIGIYYSNNYAISVDNERHDYKEIMINNMKAYSLYDTTSDSGTIIINDGGITVTIIGNIQKNELIKIAENIVFK